LGVLLQAVKSSASSSENDNVLKAFMVGFWRVCGESVVKLTLPGLG